MTPVAEPSSFQVFFISHYSASGTSAYKNQLHHNAGTVYRLYFNVLFLYCSGQFNVAAIPTIGELPCSQRCSYVVAGGLCFYKNAIGLILFFFLFLSRPGLSQNQHLRFDHLGSSHGLSCGNVFSIFQDSRGFMWFGTWQGLNKYDGYNITVYDSDPLDTQNLSNNFVTSIIESKDGSLWLAAGGGGLCRYDHNTDRFTSYRHHPADANSLNVLTLQ